MPTLIDEKALANVRPQAIPLDYSAHERALEVVRHIVAGAHKAGLGRQVAVTLREIIVTLRTCAVRPCCASGFRGRHLLAFRKPSRHTIKEIKRAFLDAVSPDLCIIKGYGDASHAGGVVDTRSVLRVPSDDV